ncbi:hypothetical protein LPJ63_002951, partial [Coemansia sp. RSA 2711]
IPEVVARAIQELDGPLRDRNNELYELAVPRERSRYSACPTCGITFSLFRRKSNCTNCGQVVCGDCLSKWFLPKYGLKTPAACCTMCSRNLHLSIKGKVELGRCSVRELRAYLTMYGLYDPNKMIEKSDLVAAVYNNSPMPNANECHYRNSLPRPSEAAKSSRRQQCEHRRPSEGSSSTGSWDRMFASIGNDIGRGLENLGQHIERGANAVNEALDPASPYYGATPAYESHTYSDRSQQHTRMRADLFPQQTHRSHTPPPPRPRSEQSNARPQDARRSDANVSINAAYVAGRPANSADTGRGAAGAAKALELKDLVHGNTDVATLSVKALKLLLLTNHVDCSNILEKQELVQRVRRLVDNARREMKSEEAAEDGGEPVSDDNTCKICWDATTNCVFLNCGHMCTCLECGNKILKAGRECPICREYIAKVVHVFRA